VPTGARHCTARARHRSYHTLGRVERFQKKFAGSYFDKKKKKK